MKMPLIGLVFPVDTHMELIPEWGFTEKKVMLVMIFRKLQAMGWHAWAVINVSGLWRGGGLGLHIKFNFSTIMKK
jgi:hypothetical protein